MTRNQKANRRIKRKQKKTRILRSIGIFALLLIAFFAAFFYFSQPKKTYKAAKYPHIEESRKMTIYPTFYVTGSSGITAPNIDILIDKITTAGNNPAKPGLKIMVNTTDDYKVKVTGKIDSDNLYPAIAVGMDKGTNDTLIYENALRAVMDYMVAHYKIPWCNMLGYSSGGSGVLRYLMTTNDDSKYPPVKKFLSLDGEYNQKINLQPGETFEQLLEKGPSKKSAEYLYWEENYQKLNPDVKVALLEANYKNQGYTDDIIPFADAFSIYHLLVKNRNEVTRYIYIGANNVTNHGHVCKNPMAQAYIERYFYQ